MLRDQVGVLAQPVAGPFAETSPHSAKAAIGGQYHRAALITRVAQLKEEVAAAGDDWLVADLVNDGRSS